MATPNETELFDAMKIDSSDHDLAELAAEVIDGQKLGGLIVTRGSRGMLVCTAGHPGLSVGIVGSRDVADVTGAGDTVAAAVALSVASNASLAEAAEMATYAAAVVVMKRGTATASRQELEAMRAEHPRPDEGGGEDR